MNVLHVLTSIDPIHGGTVEAVRSAVAATAKLGIRSDVLSIEKPKPDWFSNWPVTVHSLENSYGYYRYTPELVPWISEHAASYDAVVVHGVWRYPSFGVWRALRNSNTPYVLFTHGMLDPWFRSGYPLKHLKKSLFWNLFEHRVLRDARTVIFTTEMERTRAAQSFRPYSCRETVAGLGIPEPPADFDCQADAFFHQFPLLRSKRLILFLGRVHRMKGCDLLIESFGQIAMADPRLHLVIAGPDEEGWIPVLSRLATDLGIANRITWTGHLNSKTKWGALRAAEAVALPSHTESFGISLVEALACGTPVLTTNKVGICDDIAEYRAGLVGSDTAEDFARILKIWSSHSPQVQQEFQRQARACYVDRFQLEQFGARIQRCLVEATNSRATAAYA